MRLPATCWPSQSPKALAGGSGAILELLRSNGNSPDWSLVRSVLPHVRGWAVSTLSSHEKRVRIGTVHTFQDGECDAIVFALVAGEGMPPQSIGWVERQLFLWNVAITRARAHLLVVRDRSLWRDRGGIGAALVAATELSGEASIEVDPLLVKLKRRYPSAEPHVSSRGYLADARIDGTTILLDRGAGAADSARHLRLGLRRTELLEAPASRMPAWTLFDH
ncbi:AAA domain-containing protein [Lentzea sp. E54]|uniref:AAA domain-containing protein n=1 Tax=Lentzea xerophila TaxID=3435883 RepID=UPI003DA2B6E8